MESRVWPPEKRAELIEEMDFSAIIIFNLKSLIATLLVIFILGSLASIFLHFCLMAYLQENRDTGGVGAEKSCDGSGAHGYSTIGVVHD